MSTSAATTPEFKGVIRFHAKSRRGCLTCRKRRIKCDEARPTCRNCYRRNLECVQRPKNEDNQERRQQQQEMVLYKPLTAPTPIPINMTSFQIMHHYTTVTYTSFYSDPTLTTTSRNTLPQLSWQNPLLLHAILSCAALHLGRLYPKDSEPNWLYRASAHRKAAIDALPSTTNSDAKYLTIGFFTIYTISSSLSSSPENIFSLMTSIHNVWSALENQHGFTNQKLKDLDPLSINLQWDSTVKALEHLQRIYDPTTSSLGSESEDLSDPGIRAAYRRAVKALYIAYPFIQMGIESRCAVLWPAFFGKKYLALLNERRQRALVVLYYYLEMLRGISDKCWWVSDAARCQDYIYGLLDVGWRGWLLDVTENPNDNSTRRFTY
ncbi:c6 zinc finger domain protein [Moniliophthora roreri MCA 2997]|uniref:C6 zinc finger domain protein n=1 Tax=Moniliophthora roreri (strain MCA 2997) TaxID=1381753 RepID=V2XFM7_MONRO|nr:c6 zinc finger domain protein [Moniliophthora roreri MCA 2997]